MLHMRCLADGIVAKYTISFTVFICVVRLNVKHCLSISCILIIRNYKKCSNKCLNNEILEMQFFNIFNVAYLYMQKNVNTLLYWENSHFMIDKCKNYFRDFFIMDSQQDSNYDVEMLLSATSLQSHSTDQSRFTSMLPSSTHYADETTETTRIKCFAQTLNTLVNGIPSIYVSCKRLFPRDQYASI